MSDFRVNSITNQDGSAGPQVCGVSTFSGKSGFQIPSGSTEFRRLDGGGRGRGGVCLSRTRATPGGQCIQAGCAGGAGLFNDFCRCLYSAESFRGYRVYCH